MEKVFWLLDVNQEERDGKPEVWIWGIDEEGKRVLLIDQSFKPYFYLKLKAEADPEETKEEIEADREITSHICRLELQEKKYFGKPVRTIKVSCNSPEEVEVCVKKLSKLKGVDEVLEDDIRYATRYLIDKDLSPCSWYRIEAERVELKEKVRVDEAYIVKSEPIKVEKTEPPKLRILAFSMLCYSPLGEPKPMRDPIIAISTITDKREKAQFTAENMDEKDIIRAFIELVRKYDPDILVGFDVNSRDWNYLIERAKINNMVLYVGRTDAIPHRSVYGHFSINGRINLDLSDYVDDFAEIKLKTLESLSKFLGVKVENDVIIDEMEIPKYWEDHEKHGELLRFSMKRSRKIIDVADKILDYAIQLSNLVGIPLDYVGTAAVGFKVEWLLIRRACERGELIPKHAERPRYTYTGGLVLKPKMGLHDNVAVLDFKSLYPNIMIKYNISPDTYVDPSVDVPQDQVYEAPEVKHRFLKEPPGFYKEILTHLISVRDELKRKLKELSVEMPSYRFYDARQRAVKIITNAIYGYAGWLGARWYIKPVAEAAAAWGRYIIGRTIEISKKIGLVVIYGDTDSVFVKFDEEKINLLSKRVLEELGFEIRMEKVYVRVLFTEAKKRYGGLLRDGRLDIVGLEVVRGDWAEVAKKVQESVLRIILEKKSVEKAREFLMKYISDLKKGKIPLKDLIIWKTITKPLEEYRVNAPHLEAAKKLINKGWSIYPGDKIGYVIVYGSGPLYQRAVPYNLVDPKEIDVNYYILKQILPPVNRILKVLAKEIKKDKDLMSLIGSQRKL